MNQADFEYQIEMLQSQVAFQDETIDALNQAVTDQQQQLIVLQRQVKLLAEKVKSSKPDSVRPASEEPPPPHY